ncbi:YgjV family protein [Glaciecola sp. XM2]|uniref:YgjV family protein n=1 Tax=Glaciecola sp. XM2 TaxID=1914931 RepID=UPI001BDF1BCF|nr:YgjV family protein [Glaciecola sp. XM2]
MENQYVIAEVFGAIAVVFNFIGYRQQDINRYRLISAIALAAVSTHFFMLGALAAGIGTALASVRNIIAIYYRGNSVLALFVVLNIAFFVYEWGYLDSPWIIIIAYTSSMIFTVGSIVFTQAAQVRKWFIFAEGLGLVYAILVGSIFGTIFNITNLCSIFYVLYRDKKNASNDLETKKTPD